MRYYVEGKREYDNALFCLMLFNKDCVGTQFIHKIHNPYKFDITIFNTLKIARMVYRKQLSYLHSHLKLTIKPI